MDDGISEASCLRGKIFILLSYIELRSALLFPGAKCFYKVPPVLLFLIRHKLSHIHSWRIHSASAAYFGYSIYNPENDKHTNRRV